MNTNILYNIKFRKELPDEYYKVFTKNGFITGSSLVTTDYNDVDMVVYCNSEVVQALNQYLKALDLNDAAQFVFECLFCRDFSIYIGGNYRDSTFLSCYVHYQGVMYNLLLMDEINVVNEWKYATEKLIENKNSVDVISKYDRIRFFEKKRKEFRRKLILPI